MDKMNGDYQEYRLQNGLMVALQKTTTQTIAAKLRVNQGAIHEKEGEEGLAHFLEHCVFSGGSERYSPQEADRLKSLFGDWNATTSLGRINFTGAMLPEYIETWLELASQHAFHPRFDPKRVGEERARVLREIADEKSSSRYSFKRSLVKILYRGHPAGRFILGKEEVVQGADIEVLKELHGRGFYPNNMELIVVGKLPENITEIIERNFAQEPAGNDTRIKFPKLTDLPRKRVVKRTEMERGNLERPEDTSASVYLAWVVPDKTDSETYVVTTLASILGGGNNSRLFERLSMKKGLAYGIGVSYTSSYGAGFLEVGGKVPARRIRESIEAIFEEMQRLKDEKVDVETVEKVKRGVRYSLANNAESNEGHIAIIETKFDLGITPKEIIDKINAITPDAVLSAARKYLPEQRGGKYLVGIRNPSLKPHKTKL